MNVIGKVMRIPAAAFDALPEFLGSERRFVLCVFLAGVDEEGVSNVEGELSGHHVLGSRMGLGQ